MAEDELGEFPRIKRDLEKLLLVECERKRFTQEECEQEVKGIERKSGRRSEH